MMPAATVASEMKTAPRALQLYPTDNVAVALADVSPGQVSIIGTKDDVVTATEAVKCGHKLALRPIAAGEPVVKYGVAIGFATTAIAPGEWVHTHNCRSALDERSHTLDPHSGAATDTPYL